MVEYHPNNLLQPHFLDDGFSDLSDASVRERRIKEISLLSARRSLVEWFSYEISMLIRLISDEEGVSSAAKKLGLPREMRREIEREAKKMAVQRQAVAVRLTKYLAELPKKSQEKQFGHTLSDAAKALFGEVVKLMSIDPVCEYHFKDFFANLETLSPVFRMMDAGDPKALAEMMDAKVGEAPETTAQVASSVHRRLTVLLTAFGKSARSVADTRDQLAEKVEALTKTSEESARLGKEIQRLARLLRESEARADKSANEAVQASARNGELRSQITELVRQNSELSATLASRPDQTPAPAPDEIHAPPDSAESAAKQGDESLFSYAVALEGDLQLLRTQNESNSRLLIERADYVRQLEERLSEARREIDRNRDSFTFAARLERNVEGASADDLLRYLALSDSDISVKESAAGHLVAFFERFLQATTKGASSGMNVNGAESGTACGKYSNNLVNPVFNFLKWRGRTLHPQRFLDQMCRLDWGKLLDEYSGGEAVAMGNKKERVVTGVRHLFRGTEKPLPIFSAIGFLADMLSEYEVGNVDLGRLSDNLRTAVNEDPVKRHLKDLVSSIVPTRAEPKNA